MISLLLITLSVVMVTDLEPPIEEPILPEPQEEGGNESEQELELEIRTEGCADGHGYYENGPYRCFPIKDNGELQTEQKGASCAALGCPFNPPDLP